MSIQWNKNAVEEIAGEAMQGLASEGRQRLRTITCPVHGSTHKVNWTTRGKNISVTVDDACCDELEEILYVETQKAIR